MKPRITPLSDKKLSALDIPAPSKERIREVEALYEELIATAEAMQEAMNTLYRLSEELTGEDREVVASAEHDVRERLWDLAEMEGKLAVEHHMLQGEHDYYWTSAPDDYDGFGTRELWFQPENRPTDEYRAVMIQRRHRNWQLSRYASGLHHYVATDEAKELPGVK